MKRKRKKDGEANPGRKGNVGAAVAFSLDAEESSVDFFSFSVNDIRRETSQLWSFVSSNIKFNHLFMTL